MIYMLRPPDIAAAESEERAAALRARGFTVCKRAAYMEAWAERDRLTRLEHEIMPPGWVALQDVPVDTPAPIVEAWKAPWVLMPVPKEGT